MKKRYSLVFAICGLLAACGSVPQQSVDDRREAMDVIANEAERLKQLQEGNFFQAAGAKTLIEVVEEHRKKSAEEGSLAGYIDYYLIRQAAIKTLENNLLVAMKRADERGLDASGRSMLKELQMIDPSNRLLQLYLQSTAPADPRILALQQLAPTSKLAASFNLSLYRSLQEGLFTDRIKDALSLVRASNIISKTELNALLSAKPDVVASCIGAPLNAEGSLYTLQPMQCLGDTFEYHNLGIGFHGSAASSLSQSQLIYRPEKINTMADLMAKMALSHDVNFLLAFDRLIVFAGNQVPKDIGADYFVYTIKARYAPIMSVMNSLTAAGYTRLVTGLDVQRDTLWISSNLYDYLSAMQVISAVDVPTPQMRINLEVLEVEQSLISEIGARIPQTINFALGDPTFRYYNYGEDVPLANNGLVTQNANTGSVSLRNLLEQDLEDVMRAVVRDDGFRLAAKEQNFTVEISERPALIMESGGKANLNVGSRLPVVTSGVTSNGAITESVSMLDIGMDINLEGEVLDNNNVHLEVQLRVSNLLKSTTSTRGTSQPHLSTRSLSTSLVIEDGETAMLGGISSYDKRDDADGLPGLAKQSSTVKLGGLASQQHVKNDLVVLITPEILTPQHDLLHSMRNSAYGGERNPGVSATINRSLEAYINSSINRAIQQSLQSGSQFGGSRQRR